MVSVFSYISLHDAFLLQLAAVGARCDYALYLGASSTNYAILPEIAHRAAGLKMYLNETFTTLKLDDLSIWMKVNQLVLGSWHEYIVLVMFVCLFWFTAPGALAQTPSSCLPRGGTNHSRHTSAG